VKRRARELRREMTHAEGLLWQELRGGRLGGLHFRRQHAFGSFILDFYCATAGLCIEVDGKVHEGREEVDRMRTDALATRGIRVIRFRNEEVLTDLPRVLARIASTAAPAR
jgi:very-short-patch-repair endonuclease